MPSKSSKQQRLMGAALAAKRGKKTFPMAQKIAEQMSETQLEDFSRKSGGSGGGDAPKKQPKRSYLS